MAIDLNTKIIIDSGRLYYDVDGDGRYDSTKDLQVSDEVKDILSALGTTSGGIVNHTLSEILNSIDVIPTAVVDEEERVKQARDKIVLALQKFGDAKQRIADLKSKSSLNPAEKEELNFLEKSLLGQLKKEMKGLYDFAKANLKDGSAFKSQLQTLAQQLKAAGVHVDTDGGAGKAAVTPDGDGAGGARAAGTPKGAEGPPQGGFQFAWGAGGGRFGVNGGFNMDAYLNSIYTDQSIFDGWDSVGKNQAQQQKMMMMFFYFATMAMSGDLGAMYRFMQFITYIISKDKAMQNIHMASKLIEMEDSSRKALDELLQTPTPDGQNQQASYEFTKVMERTKATQSSIATSQKLIAQMMEEMSQVVETLTGATQHALDANGRIMQRVTRA